MPFWIMLIPQLIGFLVKLPEIIKALKDIISALRGMKDGDEKETAVQELKDIKDAVLEKKLVTKEEQGRIKALRDRLKERRQS